jgi:hypothetical protein
MKIAKGPGLALPGEAGVFGDELLVWIEVHAAQANGSIHSAATPDRPGGGGGEKIV